MNEIFHDEDITQEAKTGKFSNYQDVSIQMTKSLKEQCPEREEDINSVADEDALSKRES